MSWKTFIIFILIIFLILGATLIWWPKYQEIGDLKLKIKRKKVELQLKEDYFSELNRLSEKLKGYSSELAKIDSALPPYPSIPSLFNFLGKASSENGLVLEKVNLDRIVSLEKEGSKIKKISISLSVSGSYDAFKSFLSMLQRSAKLIDIETISFSSPRREGETFSFDLKIKTYSY